MTITIRKARNGKGLEVDIAIAMPDGSTKRIRRDSPVTSRSGTQRWAEDRIREVLDAPPAPPPIEQPKGSPAPTLRELEDEYITYCQTKRQKASWIEFKRSAFRNWLCKLHPSGFCLGDFRLNEITNAERLKLEQELLGCSIDHRNNVLNVLSTALEFAKDEQKYITEIPCTIKMLDRKSREMEFHEVDVYERLVTAAATLDPRTLIVVLLGGDAGFRIGEIVALERNNIDYQRRYIVVEQREYRGELDVPKGREKNNKVNMSTRLVDALQAHRGKGRRVLQRDDGRPITRRIASRWIEHAERKAGLPVTGKLHILRHTFASHLAAAGAPESVIGALAGHGDPQTTKRYIHQVAGVGRSAIELLEQSRSKTHGSATSGALLEQSRSNPSSDSKTL